MTHEPDHGGPEGGEHGNAWLDDARDEEPEPLPGVPIGVAPPPPPLEVLLGAREDET